METLWSTLIASAASLAGVALGIFSTRSAERSQDARAAREQRAKSADAVADELIGALRQLRNLPEPYFEEFVRDVYLPQFWYEHYEPALLRRTGDLHEAQTRNAVRLIVNSLGDLSTHGDSATTYHYLERQLLLALEIVQASRRGQAIDAASQVELDALRARSGTRST